VWHWPRSEAAFGVRRDRVLACLSEFGALRHVAFVNEKMTGYGAACGPISLDVPVQCARLARWATEHGLRSLGEAPLMVAGGRLPGDRRRIFAPLMQALG
jgi:hypothetical protein